MRTPCPTTWSALAHFKLVVHHRYPMHSGLRLFGGRYPTNPLVPRKWRNVLPQRSRSRVARDRLSYIRRYRMHRTRENRFLSHKDIVLLKTTTNDKNALGISLNFG